jgi:AraC family transcriptional regulator
MEDGTRAINLGIDWAVGAERVEYYLSKVPVHGAVETHSAPTDTRIDYHAALEVGIVLSGQQERIWDGFSCQAGPGDVWLASMWELHGYRTIMAQTTIVVLQFTRAFLEDLMLANLSWLAVFGAPAETRPHISNEKQRKRVQTLAQWMREEIENRPSGYLSSVRLCLSNVLLELCREWRPPRSGHLRGDPLHSCLSRIMPALDLLRERGPSLVGVAEASSACAISRTTLNRLCHQAMGLSFGQLRLRARLVYAARQLVATNLSIDEVASEVGFSDGSHLHRSFVKLYKQTPGQFRDSGRRRGVP